MDEPERPSVRLVEQRMRNRAMEALVAISEGDAGVRSVGVGEYVEQFFDAINDDIPWHWRDWSCFTPEEVERLDEGARTPRPPPLRRRQGRLVRFRARRESSRRPGGPTMAADLKAWGIAWEKQAGQPDHDAEAARLVRRLNEEFDNYYLFVYRP